MVRVNLELLSTSELRNLSQQEKIDGYSEMDREELISSLTEKFEEENSNYEADDEHQAKTLNIKYVQSFSDYSSNSDTIKELPGVEELPQFYQETSIHFLYKNPDWGYVFWSISSLDEESILEKKGNVLLCVSMFNKNGVKETYDIFLSEDDREWNIGFSHDALECFVSLVVEYPDGKRDILVQSNTIKLPESYWLENKDKMKENDMLFKVYLSLITTKTGEVLSNVTVSEILDAYREEDNK